MNIRTLPLAITVCLVAGCSLAPTYHRPSKSVPDAYPEHKSVAGSPQQAPPDWHAFFKDPVLQKLIALALANNRQLRVAAADMARARAEYGARRAQLFPEIDLGAYAGRQRLPGMVQRPGDGTLGPIQNNRNEPSTFNTFQVQGGFTSYELDFFGRERSMSSESGDLAKASVADYAAARIALIGEVANAYLSLNADRALLQLSDRTLAAQEKQADIMHKAFADGGVAEYDMRRAQTLVDHTKVQREQVRMDIAKDIDALAVLIGQPLPKGYGTPSAWQAPLLTDVPAGLPSALLERRPDIIAAEERLRAANQDIGRARAAFFPNIALTAVLGTLSGNLSNLFTAGATTWNGAASIGVPLLDWGRRSNDLEGSKAGKKGAIAAYQGTVQEAFREVADALAVRDHIEPQLKDQKDLVRHSQRLYQIAQARFHDGVTQYLDTEDAERTLNAAKRKLIKIQLQQAVNQVDLYKALGGGWNPPRTHGTGRIAQAGKSTVTRC